MNRCLKKFREMLLYAGASREDYERVRAEISESNRSNLFVFTLLVAAAMIVMCATSFFVDSLQKNRLIYTIGAVAGVILFALSAGPAKKRRLVIDIAMYVFVGLLFAFGIALGTIIEPNETTVSYVVLMFAVPLLFTDRPLRMGIASVISMLIYFHAAEMTQNPIMREYNFSNVLPYGIISIVVSSYMMKIKVDRFVYAAKNRFLSESDQLTGFLNRRSYEQHIQKLREKGCESITVCAFDVNGLKKVNDTLGHKAGDELIRGAADCISGVFLTYGRCYRIGGDEFVTILDSCRLSDSELREMLTQRTTCWNGTLVSGLSISMGIARGDSASVIDELVQSADKDMYECKRDYYDRTRVATV